MTESVPENISSIKVPLGVFGMDISYIVLAVTIPNPTDFFGLVGLVLGAGSFFYFLFVYVSGIAGQVMSGSGDTEPES